jgi:hypothetical protein
MIAIILGFTTMTSLVESDAVIQILKNYSFLSSRHSPIVQLKQTKILKYLSKNNLKLIKSSKFKIKNHSM